MQRSWRIRHLVLNLVIRDVKMRKWKRGERGKTREGGAGSGQGGRVGKRCEASLNDPLLRVEGCQGIQAQPVHHLQRHHTLAHCSAWRHLDKFFPPSLPRNLACSLPDRLVYRQKHSTFPGQTGQRKGCPPFPHNRA